MYQISFKTFQGMISMADIEMKAEVTSASGISQNILGLLGLLGTWQLHTFSTFSSDHFSSNQKKNLSKARYVKY